MDFVEKSVNVPQGGIIESAGGTMKVIALLDKVRVKLVEAPRGARFGNINTPKDLSAIKRDGDPNGA